MQICSEEEGEEEGKTHFYYLDSAITLNLKVDWPNINTELVRWYTY